MATSFILINRIVLSRTRRYINVTSKTPCLADERASAKEIGKFVFGVASMSGLSGFRDNETADARANVRSPQLRLL